MPLSLELVAAVAANGVIGRGNQLPWHLPDDLKHFKQLTLGHPIIMGRRTFESIGKPLPGRRNIVVSTTQTPVAGVEIVSPLERAEEILSSSASRAFVIGGAALYAAALPRASMLHLTEIADTVEGEVFFPQFDRAQRRLISNTRHARDDRHAHDFRFCTYERIDFAR